MKGFFNMKPTCELCKKETKDRVSYLELETWEFEFLKEEKKDFYTICFSCFDEHTQNFIDKEMDLESRKKRASLVSREIQEEIEAILASES
jgi:hypothetical protein